MRGLGGYKDPRRQTISETVIINLFSTIIKANDIITLIQGSHGFKTIEPVEMLEVKQGPFHVNHDKIKFKKIDEKEIKIK